VNGVSELLSSEPDLQKKLYLPLPGRVDASPWYGAVEDTRHRCALEDANEEIRNGPASRYGPQHQARYPEALHREYAIVESHEGHLIEAVRKRVPGLGEPEELRVPCQPTRMAQCLRTCPAIRMLLRVEDITYTSLYPKKILWLLTFIACVTLPPVALMSSTRIPKPYVVAVYMKAARKTRDICSWSAGSLWSSNSKLTFAMMTK